MKYLGIFSQLILILGIGSLAFANQTPIVDNLSSSSPTVAPGGVVTVTVSAHDPDCAGTCTSGCGQYIRSDLTQWSATGGAFSATNNGSSASPYSADVQWQAPATEGTYTITISLSDSGSFLCGGRLTTTASIDIQVTTSTNRPPLITSLQTDKDMLFIGESTNVTATVSDPDGDPITYTWTTTLGTITPGEPSTATYLAPTIPGIAKVICTVTDDKGAFSSNSTNISVTSVLPDKTISSGLFVPQRLATDSYGYAFVADRKLGGLAVVNLSDTRNASLIPVPDITSVAIDSNNRLLVGTKNQALILKRDGSLVKIISYSNLYVSDVAVDITRQRYAVLYGDASRVVMYDSSGNILFAFGANGDNPGQFKGATGLAVNSFGDFFVGDSGHGLIHVFDVTGQYVRSFGGRGTNPGNFVQLDAIAVDEDGIIYASDSFQSTVQIFNSDGTLREVVGTYGSQLGQFITPAGIALSNGYRKLVVASLNASSLQVFSLQGTSDPPANTPPTVPVPTAPDNGAILPHGSPVILTVLNSSDPDYQALNYEFELYSDSVSDSTLVRRWVVPESTTTTQVDASFETSTEGNYVWRVRVWDGATYSGWTEVQNFQIEAPPVNHIPSVPVLQSPVKGAQTSGLTPTLMLQNATDPDGDSLTYFFEVALDINGEYRTVAASSEIAEGQNATSWQVSCGILEYSQEAYWRARAYDGLVYGDWTEYETFITPPFPIPSLGAFGNIPDGDTTRPEEVRYVMGPGNVDTTLYFRVYDITFGSELQVVVNSTYMHTIPAQVADAWSPTTSVTIPANELDPNNLNYITFVHVDPFNFWGVQKVSFTPPFASASVTLEKQGAKPTKDGGVIPVLKSPIKGVRVSDLTPTLVVENVVNPAGNAFSYVFEVALRLNDSYYTLFISPEIAEGQDVTSWQIPCGILELSQKIYWRSRVYDGLTYGDWSNYENFRTPPFTVPSSYAYGNIPDGDITRPEEVRYIIDSNSVDATLYLQAYDITKGNELKLVVNGLYEHAIPVQTAAAWSGNISITIPSNELDANNFNYLSFVHRGSSDVWGVRKVSVILPAAGVSP